jgi:murein DD-endopeptidase MepM/ murein hydrolase activator NlpD
VRAADHGKVVHVVAPGTRGFSGYGATVVIEHARPNAPGKVWTLYAHLKAGSARVAVGQEVSRGDVIAEVGRTCGTVAEPRKLCGGAHLHFEVSKRPYPQQSEAPRLDPTFFLSAAP